MNILKLNGKRITKINRAYKQAPLLTFFVVFHKQPIKYAEKAIESVVNCHKEGYADYRLSIIKNSLIHDYIISNHPKILRKCIIVCDEINDSRNNRILNYYNKIETEYLMLVDGDDFVDIKKAKKINEELSLIKCDFLIIHGEWHVYNDISKNITIKFTKEIRKTPGLWCQSQILSKRLVERVSKGSEMKDILKCYSISDNILGAVMMDSSIEVRHTELDSPYIHREYSASSKNSISSNKTNFWRDFYNMNNSCSQIKHNSIDEALQWIYENTKNLELKKVLEIWRQA